MNLIVLYYRATINSISHLHNFYVNYGKQEYQSRLKDRLIKTFGDKILFQLQKICIK